MRQFRLIFLCLLLAACAAAPASITPMVISPTLTPLDTRTPTPVLIVPRQFDPGTPTLALTITLTPAAALPQETLAPTRRPGFLSAEGPWLVASSDGAPGLMAFNADGSGWAPIRNDDGLTWWNSISASTGQGGQWLALRGVKDVAAVKGVYFDLVHLPDNQVISITRLDSDWPDPGSGVAIEASGAVWNSSILWSPDGKYIAFSAALDGSKYADLYLAQTAKPGLIRLSAMPHHAYPLAWTPDSRRILYAEINGCGGTGCSVDSVWMSTPAKQAVKLADANGVHWEFVAGFTRPDQAVLYGRNSITTTGLSLYNLSTGQVDLLYAGTFTSAAVDPATQTILFASLTCSDCHSPHPEGLYAVSGPGEKPRLIEAGSWNKVTWLPEINRFMAGGTQIDGTLLVAPDGTTTAYPHENWWTCTPQVSPDRQRIAFCGGETMDETAGLRVYDLSGQLTQTITTAPVDWVTWRPDTESLFYHSNGTLYFLKDLAGSPTAVTKIDGGYNVGTIWIR